MLEFSNRTHRLSVDGVKGETWSWVITGKVTDQECPSLRMKADKLANFRPKEEPHTKAVIIDLSEVESLGINPLGLFHGYATGARQQGDRVVVIANSAITSMIRDRKLEGTLPLAGNMAEAQAALRVL